MTRHKYTAEQVEYIEQIAKGRFRHEITEMFNKKFGLNQSVESVRHAMRKHNITNDIRNEFPKGYKPWNKGRKLTGENYEKTRQNWFKKGERTPRQRNVGDERIVKGYTEVKVAEPNVWKSKQVVIWESVYGPIPNGYQVIFLDRNKQNFELDNLKLVSKKQIAVMNRYGLLQDDKDLTNTGILIADIKLKMGEIKRNIGK